MIANELKNEGEELFINFSKKRTDKSFDEASCREYYEKYLNKTHVEEKNYNW